MSDTKGAEDGVITAPSSILPHTSKVDEHVPVDIAKAAEGSVEDFKAEVDRAHLPSVPQGQTNHPAIMERSQAEQDRVDDIVEQNKADYVEGQKVHADKVEAEREQPVKTNDELEEEEEEKRRENKEVD